MKVNRAQYTNNRRKVCAKFANIGFCLCIASIAIIAFFSTPALAQVNTGINQVGETLALGGGDIRIIIAQIIRIALSLLGIIAVALIMYGGYEWMTSGGEEEKIAKAKKILTNAVIGLAIILSAFAITQFVLNKLLDATGGVRSPGAGGAPGAGIPRSGSLGAGIIEDHFPARGATVCRNTRIVITFKEAIDPASVAPATKIYPADLGEAAALRAEQINIGFTDDHRTFVFRTPLLGSPSARTVYDVSLSGGANGIKLASGAPAFEGSFGAGYLWDFTVDTCIDATPPRVTEVIPRRASREPRNTIIQINFSESMDPTTVAGILPAFQNLRIAAGEPIAGTATIGNNYRTVEFISNEACGTNSCGSTMFCLPADANITATIKAATLSTEPPAADPSIIPSDGATDMAGNSLDGNANGSAEGPGADDYSWQFQTTSAIDLTPPVIETVSPAPEQGRVAPDSPIRILFSKLMSVTSFGRDNITLTETPAPIEPTCRVWSGESADDPSVKTSAVMTHCAFPPETNFTPTVTSGVKDLRQNCYAPAASDVFPTCSSAAMAAAGASYCCGGDPCRSACELTPSGLPRCPQ